LRRDPLRWLMPSRFLRAAMSPDTTELPEKVQLVMSPSRKVNSGFGFARNMSIFRALKDI
jgi:hypothetical protein